MFHYREWTKLGANGSDLSEVRDYHRIKRSFPYLRQARLSTDVLHRSRLFSSRGICGANPTGDRCYEAVPARARVLLGAGQRYDIFRPFARSSPALSRQAQERSFPTKIFRSPRARRLRRLYCHVPESSAGLLSWLPSNLSDWARSSVSAPVQCGRKKGCNYYFNERRYQPLSSKLFW